LKQISESWIKWRNFDKQLIRLLEYVKMQNVTPDTVDTIISKSIDMLAEKGSVSFDSDLGLDFFSVDSHKQKTHKKLSSSFNFVDRITGGGYDSKTLIAYVGEQGIGKCFSGSTKIKIRNKKTGEIIEIPIENFIYKIKSNV
jgi:predicted ATP-dependent serine protease